MTKQQFRRIDAIARGQMAGSVHDAGHVERVLWNALRILASEPAADPDVVVLAVLLHDIGRAAPGQGGHAARGADMACDILVREGFGEAVAARVADCIRTHSYKDKNPPQSLEAKILFDADKLDLTGALGAARAMLFGAEIAEPLYLLGADGLPTRGKKSEGPSLYREYNRKLRHLDKKFFTKKARKIAKSRQKTMDSYFSALRREINAGYRRGRPALERLLTEG